MFVGKFECPRPGWKFQPRAPLKISTSAPLPSKIRLYRAILRSPRLSILFICTSLTSHGCLCLPDEVPRLTPAPAPRQQHLSIGIRVAAQPFEFTAISAAVHNRWGVGDSDERHFWALSLRCSNLFSFFCDFIFMSLICPKLACFSILEFGLRCLLLDCSSLRPFWDQLAVPTSHISMSHLKLPAPFVLHQLYVYL